MTRSRAVAAAVLVLLVSGLVGLIGSAALFGGDGREPAQPGGLSALPGGKGGKGSTDFTPEAAQAKLPRGASVVATARERTIRVHRRPGGGEPRTLEARSVEGRRLPLVFLVKERRDGWVHAYLPTRPNLSTGWLRASDVEFAVTRFRVQIQLDRHRLTLWRSGRRVMRAKIAKGKAISPTPTGRYYVTDLLRPPDPRGFYGPYALGLSAHSPVSRASPEATARSACTTNRPSVLGTDVSSGCIRVSNRVITQLAKRLPLGTPIDISRA